MVNDHDFIVVFWIWVSIWWMITYGCAEMVNDHDFIVVFWIWVSIWWMITYGCEEQIHKVCARPLTVAARNGSPEWQTQVSKAAIYGQNQPFLPRTALEPAQNV